MTINKSHGQTIPNVGIYLREPVFSHGQLHVAFVKGYIKSYYKDFGKTKKRIRSHWEEHQEYSLQGRPELVITGEYHLSLPIVRILCWTMFLQDFYWTAVHLEVDILFCSLVFFCRTRIADPANLTFHSGRNTSMEGTMDLYSATAFCIYITLFFLFFFIHGLWSSMLL